MAARDLTIADVIEAAAVRGEKTRWVLRTSSPVRFELDGLVHEIHGLSMFVGDFPDASMWSCECDACPWYVRYKAPHEGPTTCLMALARRAR